MRLPNYGSALVTALFLTAPICVLGQAFVPVHNGTGGIREAAPQLREDASDGDTSEPNRTNDTTILAQDFDGEWSTANPPPGWLIRYEGSPDTNIWHRSRDYGETLWSENTTHFALFKKFPDVLVSESLISPVFDCSGLGGIELRCSTFLCGGANQPYSAQIIGTTDGGANWAIVRDYAAGSSVIPARLESLDLAWAGDQAQVRVAWVYEGRTGDFNWWALDNVTVTGTALVVDPGTIRITTPERYVDYGAILTPSAWVRNFGNVSGSLQVRFTIPGSQPPYDCTQWVRDLYPGDSTQIIFDPWQAMPGGLLAMTCSTQTYGDRNPENDAVHTVTEAVARDVGVDSILEPGDTVYVGEEFTTTALVRNFSAYPTSVPVMMRIDNILVLLDTVNELGPFAETTAVFARWVPTRPGTFGVVCTTWKAHDINPENDGKRRTVHVVPRPGLESEPLSRFGTDLFETACPNPFSFSTTLSYRLAREASVELAVYSAGGRRVRALPSSRQTAGVHRLTWNGEDDGGRAVGPGIYLCRLRVSGFSDTRKLLKLE